jgi:membrane associated rhomboid family serine protease
MLTPWVSRIIFANVAIFLAEKFIGLDLRQFALVAAFIPVQPWTLVTYMFLHHSFGHLFFNMLSLYIFGPRLEAELGGRRFVGLYLVSGVAGGLLSWVFSPYVPIIGASGAILGVMYGYARFWPRDQIYLWFFPMQVRVAVIVMTALDLFGGFSGGDNVAHFAHLGGVVGAVVYLMLVKRGSLAPVRMPSQPRISRPSRTDLDRWSKIRPETLHEVNREELERIMRKISEEGPASVTPQERTFLDTFSNR